MGEKDGVYVCIRMYVHLSVHTYTCMHISAHVCGHQSIVSDIVAQVLSSLS